jgi:integrase
MPLPPRIGIWMGLFQATRSHVKGRTTNLLTDSFCNVNGDYFPLTTLYYSFQELLKQAELPHIRFHDLRHSAATILLSMGVPAKVIQELLGHNQISITLNTYSHVLPSMQKMNEVFKQQSR